MGNYQILQLETPRDGFLKVFKLTYEIRIPGRGRGTWEKREEYFASWQRVKGRESLYEQLSESDGSIRNLSIRVIKIDCRVVN